MEVALSHPALTDVPATILQLFRFFNYSALRQLFKRYLHINARVLHVGAYLAALQGTHTHLTSYADTCHRLREQQPARRNGNGWVPCHERKHAMDAAGDAARVVHGFARAYCMYSGVGLEADAAPQPTANQDGMGAAHAIIQWVRCLLATLLTDPRRMRHMPQVDISPVVIERVSAVCVSYWHALQGDSAFCEHRGHLLVVACDARRPCHLVARHNTTWCRHLRVLCVQMKLQHSQLAGLDYLVRGQSVAVAVGGFPVRGARRRGLNLHHAVLALCHTPDTMGPRHGSQVSAHQDPVDCARGCSARSLDRGSVPKKAPLAYRQPLPSPPAACCPRPAAGGGLSRHVQCRSAGRQLRQLHRQGHPGRGVVRR